LEDEGGTFIRTFINNHFATHRNNSEDPNALQIYLCDITVTLGET